MIQHTFSFLQGIGEVSEQRLWREGIRCWDDFLNTPTLSWIAPAQKRLYDETLQAAALHLAAHDADFFRHLLNPRDHWRLFPEMREYAVALDIETDGAGVRHGGCVTVVGLYDGFDYQALVRGSTLSARRLAQELKGYSYMITFFGTVFDLPFLRESLGVSYTGLHFDLCFAARRVGMKGGLKTLERRLGMVREEAVQGLDGFDAVLLWRAAQQGDDEALRLLVAYNRCDTVSLFQLADVLYAQLRQRTGFDSLAGARMPVAVS